MILERPAQYPEVKELKMEIAATSLDNLIKVLEEQRAKRQLDHRQFSAFLGISESYWSMIRTGERKPNLNVLSIMMQKLPEITPEAIMYILQTIKQGNDDTIQKG